MQTRSLGLLAGLLLCASFSMAAPITFNFNGNASGLGSGCQPEDIELDDHETILKLTIRGYEARLTGDRTAVRSSCRIVVPIRIDAGWYIDSVNSTTSYRYTLDRGTEGKVQLAITPYANNTFSYQYEIPAPGKNPENAKVRQMEKEKLSGTRQWCGLEPFEGNLKISTALTGFRENTRLAFASVASKPFIKLEFGLKRCDTLPVLDGY